MLEPLIGVLRAYGPAGFVMLAALTFAHWLATGRLYTRGQWERSEASFLRETQSALAHAEERIRDWQYHKERSDNLAAAATKTTEVVTEMAADLKARLTRMEEEVTYLRRLLDGERRGNGGAAS